MAPPLGTSALIANPRLSPEARQAIRERVDAVHAKFRARHGGLGPEQFGVQCCQITQFPAAAFKRLVGEDWDYFVPGYVYPTRADSELWAPVQLPSGVEIQYLDFYYLDVDQHYQLYAELRGLTGGGATSGTPSDLVLASVSSPLTNPYGYGYAEAAFTHTVNNNVGYDPDAAQLMVVVGTAGVGPFLRFKAVDLWWMRQVSPPPATASFDDVPTDHPYFQFVEALKAAGITSGCGDSPPLFCVDAPITRGQMAVFLSKALGLYWRY